MAVHSNLAALLAGQSPAAQMNPPVGMAPQGGMQQYLQRMQMMRGNPIAGGAMPSAGMMPVSVGGVPQVGNGLGSLQNVLPGMYGR